MPPSIHHECTRVPVTALASCGALLVAAEGPFLRFYHAKDSRYIASKRVFRAQTVHGISVYAEDHDHTTKLVIWGGRLVRAIRVALAYSSDGPDALTVLLSGIGKAPDWILDLAPRPISLEDEAVYQRSSCVAVTAHNALLQIDIEQQHTSESAYSDRIVSVTELTSSSRSILYSAHVFWESQDCVLVAAGTAFGEIMYWSWRYSRNAGNGACVHRVFLGHEGSIFGVRISKELPTECCQGLKRIIASCSDDRTIRIWDVSDIDPKDTVPVVTQADGEPERIRHTGFSNAAFDVKPFSSSECLAIGWGHASRVWKAQFLQSKPCDGTIYILSAGEDATSRTWRLSPDNSGRSSLPYQLVQIDCAAYHSGKNLWSTATYTDSVGVQQAVCGAADAKISTYLIKGATPFPGENLRSSVHDLSVQDVLELAQVSDDGRDVRTAVNHKSSKRTEFFRSYCSLSKDTFLLTTNSGKVLRVSLKHSPDTNPQAAIVNSVLIDHLKELSGYSVCTSDPVSGRAFVAGSSGAIFMYSEQSKKLAEVTKVNGKVGELFTTNALDSIGCDVTVLLITLVGQKQGQLHYLDIDTTGRSIVVRTVLIPIEETLTGSMITGMAHVTTHKRNFSILGFRRGAIAIYEIPDGHSEASKNARLRRVIGKAHGDEAVTSLEWLPSSSPSVGHLLSVGRDGCMAIHEADLLEGSLELVHNLALPVGTNVEGLYFHNNHILAHGFSSKKWFLYDVNSEEELMSVETGGAHRSWAFQPDWVALGAGTLVWTRASSMHIYSQKQPSHGVLRSGGHGREIKALTVSPSSTGGLIATGAEDTDIKIFKYVDGEITCRRTLRKHTTGIQHMQWSDDGHYLFSSGGCEEFYVWRVRQLPSSMDIGVVCEHTYAPESEHSDLRIMSFDVTKNNNVYIIAMVFSDSTLKVYGYDTTASVKWRSLAKGLYYTSCLMQCAFLSPNCILTAGTDGHAVLWHVSSKVHEPDVREVSALGTMNWHQTVPIHQSSSKALETQQLSNSNVLITSGGDDGSIAILLATSSGIDSSNTKSISRPVLLKRAHGSAITACVILSHQTRTYVLTSGNDQWIRLWQVKTFRLEEKSHTHESLQKKEDSLEIVRLGKVKTSVADVSSMAVLNGHGDELATRVLICGVGMEVIRLEWHTPGQESLGVM